MPPTVKPPISEKNRANWLFVDINSYFASVEQETRPELRGQPIGIVPIEAKTACVIAASYQAKTYGVKTGIQVGSPFSTHSRESPQIWAGRAANEIL